MNKKKNPEFSAIFAAMEKSGYKRRLSHEMKNLGLGAKKQEYWASGIEIFARCFECYVQGKLAQNGRENTYLAGLCGGALWPNSEETNEIAPLFDSLFDAIRAEF